MIDQVLLRNQQAACILYDRRDTPSEAKMNHVRYMTTPEITCFLCHFQWTKHISTSHSDTDDAYTDDDTDDDADDTDDDNDDEAI